MNGLRAVLEMTDRVQAALAGGDWQAARDLEVLRRGLLEQWLAQVGLADAGVAAAITDLEQRGRHMIGDVQHHRGASCAKRRRSRRVVQPQRPTVRCRNPTIQHLAETYVT